MDSFPPVSGCSSPVYIKGDGFPACAIILEGTYDFLEAETACEKRGGKLPEIFSQEENDIITTYRVFSPFSYKSIFLIV